jgi:hypothetical protein
MLWVVGVEDGVTWSNIYRVTKDQWFQASGVVRAHEGAIIRSVGFAGNDHIVPESGATFGLFLIGLLGLMYARH